MTRTSLPDRHAHLALVVGGVLVWAVALFALACASAGAATVRATPSSFASTFSSAQAGDTILLASGSYGTWTGTK